MALELHNRYRPTTFDEVVGQDPVVRSLRDALDKGSTRSFLFTGPSGCGKTTLARIIAREVNCAPANLMEVDAATYTGIDAMRALKEALQYVAIGGGGVKVIIIDEAHALSKAAWQSLLKDVEEPPAHVWWFFCTTESSKIPDTIKTRCQCYELSPVKPDDLFDLVTQVAKAEGARLGEDVLDLVCTNARGSPRRALTALGKVLGCEDAKQAAAVLRESSEDGDAIDLVRALMKGRPSWAKAMKLVKPLEGQNPESIRLTITAYLTQVILNSKGDEQAAAALTLLEAFKDPYPPVSTLYPLLLSVGEVLYAQP